MPGWLGKAVCVSLSRSRSELKERLVRGVGALPGASIIPVQEDNSDHLLERNEALHSLKTKMAAP